MMKAGQQRVPGGTVVLVVEVVQVQAAGKPDLKFVQIGFWWRNWPHGGQYQSAVNIFRFSNICSLLDCRL
jgi:hypothetical protein